MNTFTIEIEINCGEFEISVEVNTEDEVVFAESEFDGFEHSIEGWNVGGNVNVVSGNGSIWRISRNGVVVWTSMDGWVS